MQTTQRGRRTPTIYYVTQKTGQICMLLLEKDLAFVSFQNPSISISLFQAGRYGCLFSRYLVEWQRVWLISCCWRPGPMKGSKKKRKGWVFLRAAMAAVHFSPDLLSEKPVTSLMINAPARRAVSKPRQTLNPDNLWDYPPTPPPQPRAFNLSLSSCETNQWQPLFAQVGGRFSRVL